MLSRPLSFLSCLPSFACPVDVFSLFPSPFLGRERPLSATQWRPRLWQFSFSIHLACSFHASGHRPQICFSSIFAPIGAVRSLRRVAYDLRDLGTMPRHGWRSNSCLILVIAS